MPTCLKKKKKKVAREPVFRGMIMQDDMHRPFKFIIICDLSNIFQHRHIPSKTRHLEAFAILAWNPLILFTWVLPTGDDASNPLKRLKIWKVLHPTPTHSLLPCTSPARAPERHGRPTYRTPLTQAKNERKSNLQAVGCRVCRASACLQAKATDHVITVHTVGVAVVITFNLRIAPYPAI